MPEIPSITREIFVQRFKEELERLQADHPSRVVDFHRAFDVRALELHRGLDTEEAIDAARHDGQYDRGIDAKTVDEDEHEFALFQFTCPDPVPNWNPFAQQYDEGKVRELVDAFRMLQDPIAWSAQVERVRVAGHEEKALLLQDLGEEYQRKRAAGFSVRLFAVIGGVPGPGVEPYLSGSPQGADVGLEVVDIEDLYALYKTASIQEEVPPEYIDLGFVPGHYYLDPVDGVVFGQVLGSEVKEAVKDHESELLGANYRFFLRFTKRQGRVNQEMRDTLSKADSRALFHKFNNGIRITCTRISPLGNDRFRLDRPQIVNGGQTTIVIRRSANEWLSDQVKVDVKAIVADRELAQRVARATNSQSVLEGWDFHANEPAQRSLVTQFSSLAINGASHPHWWEIKRGEFGALSREQQQQFKIPGFNRFYRIDPDDLSKSTLAMRGDPVSARSSSRLFSKAEVPGKYNEVFAPGISVEEYVYYYYAFKEIATFCKSFAKKLDEALDNGFAGMTEDSKNQMTQSAWLRYGSAHLSGLYGYLLKRRYGVVSSRTITTKLMATWMWPDGRNGLTDPQDGLRVKLISLIVDTIRPWAFVTQRPEGFDWSNYFKNTESFEEMVAFLSAEGPHLQPILETLLPSI